MPVIWCHWVRAWTLDHCDDCFISTGNHCIYFGPCAFRSPPIRLWTTYSRTRAPTSSRWFHYLSFQFSQMTKSSVNKHRALGTMTSCILGNVFLWLVWWMQLEPDIQLDISEVVQKNVLENLSEKICQVVAMHARVWLWWYHVHVSVLVNAPLSCCFFVFEKADKC